MLTTQYINPLQHRVFNGATLVGYVTLHRGGWLFTAATKALASVYAETVTPAKHWQDALPVAA